MYTPGPWRLFETVRHYELIKDPVTATSYDLAHISKSGLSASEAAANARLMANAPDLYEQLKALVVQIEYAGLIVPPNVRTVLDKVEGRDL